MGGGSRTSAKTRANADRSSAKGFARSRAGKPARILTPKQILIITLAVLALAAGVTLATGGRGERLAQETKVAVDRKFGRAGFNLQTVHVQGASPMATPDIIRAAGVYRDQPLLDLNLKAVRKRVEAVGWVQEARIVRLLPDTLMIVVQERPQLAVWQHAGKTMVIDDQGRPIPEADPRRFLTLPLVVGAGGAVHAGEILPTLVQRPNLINRMEALVRVDDRRWDLRLKDGSLIQLPAVDEADALARLEQLNLRSRILEIGFERIDLRNPDMVAIRPRASTAPDDLAAAGA